MGDVYWINLQFAAYAPFIANVVAHASPKTKEDSVDGLGIEAR